MEETVIFEPIKAPPTAKKMRQVQQPQILKGILIKYLNTPQFTKNTQMQPQRAKTTRIAIRMMKSPKNALFKPKAEVKESFLLETANQIRMPR